MSNILAPDFMECLIKCLWHNELIDYHLIRLTLNNEETLHYCAVPALLLTTECMEIKIVFLASHPKIKLFHLGHNMTHNVCVLAMHETI